MHMHTHTHTHKHTHTQFEGQSRNGTSMPRQPPDGFLSLTLTCSEMRPFTSFRPDHALRHGQNKTLALLLLYSTKCSNLAANGQWFGSHPAQRPSRSQNKGRV